MDLRFGLVASAPRPMAEWTALARRVESAGFDTLLVTDHLGESLAPIPSLAFVAAVTTRLRVGTFVLNNLYRRPELVAHEAASLSKLSGGRFELGIGAGVGDPEEALAGIEAGPTAERLSSFEAAVVRIRELLGTDLVPSTDPIPIMIAGSRPRMLRMAGRLGDIAGLGARGPAAGLTRAGVERRLQWIREGAAGRNLELNVNLPWIARSPEEFRRPPPLDPADLPHSPHVLIGDPETMAETLRARRDALGISYTACPESSFELVAGVIDRLRANA